MLFETMHIPLNLAMECERRRPPMAQRNQLCSAAATRVCTTVRQSRRRRPSSTSRCRCSRCSAISHYHRPLQTTTTNQHHHLNTSSNNQNEPDFLRNCDATPGSRIRRGGGAVTPRTRRATTRAASECSESSSVSSSLTRNSSPLSAPANNRSAAVGVAD
jgi:hypothetical protein